MERIQQQTAGTVVRTHSSDLEKRDLVVREVRVPRPPKLELVRIEFGFAR